MLLLCGRNVKGIENDILKGEQIFSADNKAKV
jgi:hypothetical protein